MIIFYIFMAEEVERVLSEPRGRWFDPSSSGLHAQIPNVKLLMTVMVWDRTEENGWRCLWVPLGYTPGSIYNYYQALIHTITLNQTSKVIHKDTYTSNLNL